MSTIRSKCAASDDLQSLPTPPHRAQTAGPAEGHDDGLVVVAGSARGQSAQHAYTGVGDSEDHLVAAWLGLSGDVPGRGGVVDLGIGVIEDVEPQLSHRFVHDVRGCGCSRPQPAVHQTGEPPGIVTRAEGGHLEQVVAPVPFADGRKIVRAGQATKN